MALNLIRNARVFFTTNVDTTTGAVATSSHTSGATTEIQVLDGLSFSQNTTQETVTVNEAGATPVRGQISYNTGLDPVDWSFSTYMRPSKDGTNHTCEERVLWNAMASTAAVGTANAGWTSGSASGVATWDNSNFHTLQKFGLIIAIEGGATYRIDNCAVESASIDFAIDGIATIAWSGRGTKMVQDTNSVTFAAATSSVSTVTGAITGAVRIKDIASNKYIANKLSTATVFKGIGGTAIGNNNSWTVPITGGNITIANNLTYLTPATVGVVNEPCAHFNGTRTVTGNLTAYLKTGNSQDTGNLLTTLLGQNTDDTNKYRVQVILGGNSSTTTRVEVNVPAAQIQVPQINTEQLVTTTINFTGQPYTNTEYDIEKSNELELRYYAP